MIAVFFGARPRAALSLAIALAAAAASPARGQVALGTRSVPSPAYFVALATYNDGDYREALQGFGSAGGLSTAASKWVDSICPQTMSGECYYQMGQYDRALEFYTRAVQLYVTYSDWMLRIEFSPAIQPAGPGQARPVPWGQSARAARLGHFPDTYSYRQGTAVLPKSFFRQGGQITPPSLFPVHAAEIVRCTALAIRRRAELLGPSSKHDKLTGDLVVALSRRPGPPNHWSESWIDLQLGLAYLAAGKDAQAKPSLERAIVANGEFNHPLTSIALLELGRMALAAGNFDEASANFAEASYAAAQFPDAGVLEEAFRYGLLSHLLANRQGMFAPLANGAAAVWARAQSYRHLQVSLLLLAAENNCTLGNPKGAVTLLADAKATIGRRSMQQGKIGARMNWLAALAAFQQGNPTAGDQALTAALNFQRTGSLWLFHIKIADLYAKQTARLAVELYNVVLRDPTGLDWATDPMESLSVLVNPHPGPFERWFEATMERQDYERALEISDLIRRHAFLATLELGGRLHNLRWVLEGPPEVLDQKATLQKQDLLARYPRYDELSREARQLMAQLKQAGPAPADKVVAKQQQDLLARLEQLSGEQEMLLRQMAIRRDGCELVFPPRRSYKDLQGALQPGQAILSFHFGSRQPYAFLMTREKYGYWKIPPAEVVQKPIVKLLQDLGNYDANRPTAVADLSSEEWKKTGNQIVALLIKGANVDFTKHFQQLTIVPEGPLWYLPFEALPLGEADKSLPLITRLPIRYAPTLGCAIPDGRPRARGGATAVLVGKLNPGADDAAVAAGFEELSRAVPGAVEVSMHSPNVSAALATLCDRLVVLSDIPTADTGPYAWSPTPTERATGATGALAAWFALPWGSPEEIYLPGFHTAAETSLKKPGKGLPGTEVFLSVCGLMANGARTVLLTRWRTGGQSSLDLVREFAQELPHASAANAWQRSVLLASDRTLNPDSEPRLKASPRDEAPRADHPFFWAGFLLADTGTLPDGEAQKLAEAPPAAAQPPAAPPAIGEQKPMPPKEPAKAPAKPGRGERKIPALEQPENPSKEALGDDTPEPAAPDAKSPAKTPAAPK